MSGAVPEVVVWGGAALAASLLTAGMTLIAERSKMEPIHQMFWLRLFVLLVTAGLPLWLSAPAQPLYYLYVVLASVIFAYVDLYMFGLMARSGAGIVTRLKPLEAIGTFFIWTAITPSLAASYLQEPLRSAGIFCALLAAVYFVLRLRRCPLSAAALKIMAVPIGLAAVGIVFSKLAMTQAEDLHRGVYYYPLVQAATVLVVYIVMMKIGFLKRRLPHFDFSSRLCDKRVIITGIVLGCVHLAASIAKYYGISLAENPAYVTMIILSAPLWVLLFYGATGRRENVDVLSGLGVLASIAALVALTGF